MQQRLGAMLLRHGRVWRGGNKRGYAHRAWVDRQVFDEPALAGAFALYRGGLEAREAELAAAGARLAAWAGREPLAGPVARLGGYRGIAQPGRPHAGRRGGGAGAGSPPPARSWASPG